MAENPHCEIICTGLHQLFNALRRHHFPFEENSLPENGIYILFEKGEIAHDGLDRIVRIGTHTGQGNLGQRLSEHFLAKNKDRSIFRKNIGRALLNKRKDPFLSQWELDLTTKEQRKKHARKIEKPRLLKVEEEVSKIIRESFSFCVIQVDNKQRRCELEARLIATINQCSVCGPSVHWLGVHSPQKQIKESGLWLVQHLKGTVMTGADYERLEKVSDITKHRPR